MAPTPPPPAPPSIPPYPPGGAPLPPVIEPELPQQRKDVGNDWVNVLFGIVLVWLSFCALSYFCFRRRPTKAAAVELDCPNEPDRRRVIEHEMWRRDCEDRKRREGQGKARLSLAFPANTKAMYQPVGS